MTLKNIAKLIFMCAFLVTSIKANAQDWANLKRYQPDNESLKPATPSENRVVFMGNSITQGWVDKHPDFFKQNHYIGRGISGQTTPQMLVRFRQDVVALQPKIVVILAGTNDIAGNTGPSTPQMIMDNLSSMSEIALANHIKVILCSVLPAYDYPWRKGMQPNVKIPELNEMIKAYCTKKNIQYADYFSVMNDGNNGMKAELTTDGVHCTVKGYEVMEEILQPLIRKVLKSK